VTSLGLVQMTRKRIGQGLIEAFSTTCESCGGRGIHIHSEPVRKVSLDKDTDVRASEYMGASVEDEKPVIEEESTPEEPKSEANASPAPKRKRRRAVSTGIITPE